MLTTLGDWALPKTRRRGVVWNVRADGRGVSEIMVSCSGGLKAVLGASVGLVLSAEGETTLGNCTRSPLDLREWGDGSAVGMGEQASNMIQRFLEAQ